MLNSDVANQIMWNRLISVVEEQAQALIRTAFSTSVREAGDLSAGVLFQQCRAAGKRGRPDKIVKFSQHFSIANRGFWIPLRMGAKGRAPLAIGKINMQP